MSAEEHIVGSFDVTEVEARFLEQLLNKVNPAGIRGTETKLSLMKKVDRIVRSIEAEAQES